MTNPCRTWPDHVVALVDDELVTGELAATADRQLGYLRTRQLLDCGVSRRIIGHRVRTARWRRPTRGVIDLASEPPEELPLATRKVRAAVLALMAFGPEAIAVGLTALTLRDVWGVPISRPPQISMPRASGRTGRDDLVCRRFRRDVRVEIVHGVRAVPVWLALAQAICEVSPRTALGLLDSALHRRAISPSQLPEVRAATRRRRGCRRLEHVWELVDGRRESPAESGAWFDLWESNLEPTAVQVEIRDHDGVLVARPDLGFDLDDGSWLFVEIDGDEHHPEGNESDPARDDRLTSFLGYHGVGCEILRFRSSHLGSEGEMVRLVRARIAGRRWRRAQRSQMR